jgi:hypothetical protein
MSHFVEANRDPPFLLPPDLREWVPEDDLAHFVLEAVERVDLRHFRVNERGSGSPQYPPRLMLALLIYGYANGIFSSRRIERATYRDLGVRYLTANTHLRPRHDLQVSPGERDGDCRDLLASPAAGPGAEAVDGGHGERGQHEAGRECEPA